LAGAASGITFCAAARTRRQPGPRCPLRTQGCNTLSAGARPAAAVAARLRSAEH